MLAPVNVGDVLAGKYRVERVLGHGGMGVVVAASHLYLGDQVAIKFLSPNGMENPVVIGRFVREARTAVRIRSEYVARIFDVGTLETGAPYIVMEYLEGRDLSAILKLSGPLPVADAVEYVLQACEAIAEAHSLGIIHRDLKPANLFLSKRADGSPRIKVIDFGISKIATRADDGSKDIEMTATAAMMGSPLYMAPEQMRSARDVDARADIWSLGGILFALITGVPPFPGDSVVNIYELTREGVPPIRSLRADAPAGLDEIFQRTLNREPAQRYASVAELAAELTPFAPAHARVSAERIGRLLHPEAPTSSGHAPPAISATLPLPEPAPDDKPKSDTSPSPAVLSAASGPSLTEGSWSAPPSLPRRPRPVILFGSVAGASALALGFFVVRAQLRDPGRPTAAVAESSHTTPGSKGPAGAEPASPVSAGSLIAPNEGVAAQASGSNPTPREAASTTLDAGAKAGALAVPKASPPAPPQVFGLPPVARKTPREPEDLFQDPR